MPNSSTPPSDERLSKQIQSDQDIATRLHDANERKSNGNDYFRQSRWDEAISGYQAALHLLPRRRSKVAAPISDDNLDEPRSSVSPPDVDPKNEEEVEMDQDTPTEQLNGDSLSDSEQEEVKLLRSVLYANIGACHVKLGDHKQAVEACTEALKDNPTYEKALQRRAASNDALDTWSSLSAAQEDYNTLLPIVQSNAQKLDIESKLRRLKPRLEAAQKKETGEMLGKLKGLGDSLLGNFGLSTNNFKFEPNGQGGYSMNFVR